MKVDNELKLIPLFEQYMEYMIQAIIKLPRTEKFSIGTEFKQSLYVTLRNVMYITKIEPSNRLKYLNIIDAELNAQRIMLRVMKNFKWIDIKKFNIAMGKIYELGKVLGGLVKYYAKNNKKWIW